MVRLELQLEGVEVAFLLYYLERTNNADCTFLVGIPLDRNKLQTDGIVETSLVNDVGDDLGSTCLHSDERILGTRNYADRVPTLCNSLLPKGDVLSQLVVVGRNLLETLSLLDVELVIVVVELALHCVVRSNRGDRVLDDLNPVFAVASLLVLVVVERNNLVLEQRIDCCCIELVLISLVLVCAFLRQSPSGTLAVAFNPPSIKN